MILGEGWGDAKVERRGGTSKAKSGHWQAEETMVKLLIYAGNEVAAKLYGT